MPIKNLSEQRRLPRLGHIRLGVKRISEKSGKEYPAATEYFVLPPELVKYLGEKPTEIPIMIPVEDDELWCSQYYRCYSSIRGLVCKGDGENARCMIDTATGSKADRNTKEVVWKEVSCAGRDCPAYKANECKETMNLQFIMPDCPGLGIWQVDTSSINSIRNINSAAAMVRAVYKRISFIPLVLTLEAQEVVNPDDGKKKTVRCLNLRVRGTMRELTAAANQPVMSLLMPPPAEDEAPQDAVEEIPEKDDADLWNQMERERDKPVSKVPVRHEKAQDSPGAELIPPPGAHGFAKYPVASVQAEPPTAGIGGEPPATGTSGGKPELPTIDLNWLKTSLETLDWTGVLVYLKTQYRVTAPRVSEAVALLSPEQQREFTAEVEKRLAARQK